MIRPLVKQLGRWLGLACLLWGLTACGGGPPQQAIAAAVTRQAQLTQQQLWQGMGGVGGDTAPSPTLTVDRIQPRHTRHLTLAGSPLYEVQGSYRFSIQYPSRRSRQSQRPFSVWLQPSPDGEHWRWVRSQPHQDGPNEPRWQRETLPITP